MNLKNISVLIISLFLVLSCKNKNGSETEVSNFYEFKDYVSDVTSGLISSTSTIQIVLAEPVPEWTNNLELSTNLLSVTPNVKGKLTALTHNTIIFQPEKNLKPDTEYVFKLHLDQFRKTEKGFETFSFKAKTLKQDFTITTNQLQSYDRDWQYLSGVIRTSDVMDIETAKKLVEATQKGKRLAVKFEDNIKNGQFFNFTIDSIQRFEEDSDINISWNGTPFGIDTKDERAYTIIGKNNFQIINVEVVDGDEQYLEINFSDPIKKSQNFDGLVTIEGVNKLRYSVSGNVLKVLRFFYRVREVNL